ncbi:MAG: HAD-IA family hydrolase [Cytophagaceae bacterium]|jgi:beta-phosphoglucomutase-like phosphatase (HAD superfamily)|nr:HAD-IA family hydrolase [Cytophagaceae bacterium]
MSFILPAHIKGLIFDIDGTLADTMPAHYAASQRAAESLGFEFPLSFFLASAGTPTVKVFEALLKDQGITHVLPSKAAALKEKLYLTLMEHITPIPFTLDIVKAYAGQLPMSMGTGGTLEIALPTIEKIGVQQYIPILVSAEDVRRHKPFPDTFLTCAARMGVAPENCLVFEDAVNGFQAARDAGMEYIDVRDFHTSDYSTKFF